MPFHKVISDKQKAISIIKTYLLSLISYHFRVKRGFTLIEILVAITILSILTGVGSVAYKNALTKGDDNRRKQDLVQVKGALELYFQDNGKYPPGVGTDYSFASDAAANWIPGLVEGGYIKQLPKDPKQAGLITRLANLLPKFGGAKAPPGPQPQVAGATYVSYSTATANWVNTITVNKPAGVLSGDLLIAYISKTMYGVGDLAPSGWTLIRTDSNSSCCRSGIYYKVATSSEPASYTWNIAGSETYGIGTIQVYRGADTTSPINAHGATTPISGTSYQAPSITTTVADTRLVTFFVARNGTATWTPPTGMTEAYDFRFSTGTLTTSSANASMAAAGWSVW